jgi:hypothetical protein
MDRRADRGAGCRARGVIAVATIKPRSRQKHVGRRESGTFTLIPHAVQDSENWKRASAPAIRLLCDLARQFNGKNNGNLCASRSILRPRGWTSPEVITWATRELLHFGFIALTQRGGLHKGPSLYALTWHAIDDCKGKHGCAATVTASGAWKDAKPDFIRPKRKRSPVRDP